MVAQRNDAKNTYEDEDIVFLVSVHVFCYWTKELNREEPLVHQVSNKYTGDVDITRNLLMKCSK